MPIGSTVLDLAREIHRDFEHSLKSARIWGSGVFEGQSVKRDHELHDADVVELTERGERRARELERNYHLWELFLTHEVNLPLDHTHRDAENIEHILGPDLVRELEAKYEPPHA